MKTSTITRFAFVALAMIILAGLTACKSEKSSVESTTIVQTQTVQDESEMRESRRLANIFKAMDQAEDEFVKENGDVLVTNSGYKMTYEISDLTEQEVTAITASKGRNFAKLTKMWQLIKVESQEVNAEFYVMVDCGNVTLNQKTVRLEGLEASVFYANQKDGFETLQIVEGSAYDRMTQQACRRFD